MVNFFHKQNTFEVPEEAASAHCGSNQLSKMTISYFDLECLEITLEDFLSFAVTAQLCRYICSRYLVTLGNNLFRNRPQISVGVLQRSHHFKLPATIRRPPE